MDIKKKIYRVYRHVTPNGLVYVGITERIKWRWYPSLYKNSLLYEYIEKYGWDNILHEVIYTCDDKIEAYGIEGEMIEYYKEKGVSLNRIGSGLEYTLNYKDYNKSYYDTHREDKVKYYKLKRSTPEGKVYYRVKDYNRYHPDSVTITPLQAKYDYINHGTIPSFIKSDDIPVPDTQGIFTSTIPIGEQIPLF